MSALAVTRPPAPPGPPSASTSDRVLVARLRTGDELAFEAIFHRHQQPLLSFCRHMLGGQDDAEDALQQTFIRAHRGLHSASPPRELRPWLYAIARNCCLSAIASRRPSAPLEDDQPSLAGLADQVRDREDLRELVGDLQALPPDQRSALLLAELEELPHHEIAAIVECPVKKVKALIHQARATLIAQREARSAPCQEIRVELSSARGGELRRGPLRRHLNLCPGCRDYAAAVRAQRRSLAAVLPVVPSAGLAASILGHPALHAGATGVGAAAGGHAAAAVLSGAGSSAGSGLAAGGVAAGSGGALASGASLSVGSGAVLGGGLAAKLAIGGAVAVIASAAGATALHHRTPRRPAPAAAAHTRPAARRGPSGGSGVRGPSGLFAPGAVSIRAAAAALTPAGGPLATTGAQRRARRAAARRAQAGAAADPAPAASPAARHQAGLRRAARRQAARRRAGLRRAARRQATRRQAAPANAARPRAGLGQATRRPARGQRLAARRRAAVGRTLAPPAPANAARRLSVQAASSRRQRRARSTRTSPRRPPTPDGAILTATRLAGRAVGRSLARRPPVRSAGALPRRRLAGVPGRTRATLMPRRSA